MEGMRKERFRTAIASYLVLRDGDKVLLSKRANTGWMDGKYSMVAGHIEADETPIQALIRETREEAGIDVKPEDMEIVHIGMRQRASEDDDTYIDFYMQCSRWQGEVRNMEPEKCGGLEWFPISKLPEETLPYIQRVIEYIERGEIYSEESR
jgi:8-oxo-dGTP pyrophosphatase MutT (NUDIX family)